MTQVRKGRAPAMLSRDEFGERFQTRQVAREVAQVTREMRAGNVRTPLREPPPRQK